LYTSVSYCTLRYISIHRCILLYITVNWCILVYNTVRHSTLMYFFVYYCTLLCINVHYKCRNGCIYYAQYYIYCTPRFLYSSKLWCTLYSTMYSIVTVQCTMYISVILLYTVHSITTVNCTVFLLYIVQYCHFTTDHKVHFSIHYN